MKTLRPSLIAVSLSLLASLNAFAAKPAPKKVLNNLVTEFVNAREHGLLKEKTIRFGVPETGWFHISVTGPATIQLDKEARPLCDGNKTSQPPEAMRHLAAGPHRLAIEGRPSELTVRKIPVLQHAFYHAGDMWNLKHGPFDDWKFLKRHVLPNINVILSGGAGNPPGFA